MLKKLRDFVFVQKEEPKAGFTEVSYNNYPPVTTNYDKEKHEVNGDTYYAPPADLNATLCSDPRAHDFFCSLCKVGFTKKLGAVNHKRIKHPNETR